MDFAAIESRIVVFLRNLTGQSGLSADTELIDSGIADSLTIMDLLVFVEAEFAVRLDPADVNADVFRTPSTLVNCLSARIRSQGAIRAASNRPRAHEPEHEPRGTSQRVFCGERPA